MGAYDYMKAHFSGSGRQKIRHRQFVEATDPNMEMYLWEYLVGEGLSRPEQDRRRELAQNDPERFLPEFNAYVLKLRSNHPGFSMADLQEMLPEVMDEIMDMDAGY